MKYPALFVVSALGLCLGGCAHEASYVDREFGVAHRDAFDQQIVHKDYKYAGMPVEGIDGIYIENVMGKYLETYTEGFTKEDIDITETGFEE